MHDPWNQIDLEVVLERAEKELFDPDRRQKFAACNTWRQGIPNQAGMYAFFDEAGSVCYIGETADLRARMADACRTANHTFRRTYGHREFEEAQLKSHKFDPDTEKRLDSLFAEKIWVSFLSVPFGRLEIEEGLIKRHKSTLLNSGKKRGK